jgi:hypothetical protein
MQSADWVQYGSMQSANTRLQSAFSGLRLLTVTVEAQRRRECGAWIFPPIEYLSITTNFMFIE